MKTPSSTNTTRSHTDRLIEPASPVQDGDAACAQTRAREASPRASLALLPVENRALARLGLRAGETLGHETKWEDRSSQHGEG